MFLVWGHIQTTDAYLWSAAVSILDPRKETWWEILLSHLPGSSFLSAAQTETNRRLQLLSVLWKCIEESRRWIFPCIYLWVRSMQHEGGDAARAPEICSNTGPPATLRPRPAVSYSGLATGGRAALQLQLEEKQRLRDDRGAWSSGGGWGRGRGGRKAWWREEEEED